MNDVNATDTSFDDQTIVTGDDFGLVKLFRFPCIKKGTYCIHTITRHGDNKQVGLGLCYKASKEGDYIIDTVIHLMRPLLTQRAICMAFISIGQTPKKHEFKGLENQL